MAEEFDPLLMLASTAKSSREETERRSPDYFSLWDAQDHCYVQEDECDILVNSEHGYYQRVDQFDLPDHIEHNYAFPVPPRATSDPFEESEAGPSGLKLELCRCEWGTCDFVGDTAEELHGHIENSHLNNSSRTCQWKSCPRANPFGLRYLLVRHVNSHIGYEAFKCEECPKGFVTSERLRLHKKARHHPEVNYMCQECNQMFKTTSDRAHHISRVHCKLRLVCPNCRKIYAGRSSLRTHLKKCSGSNDTPP